MIKANKISKKDFLKINEEDVMFITNPGRMGDEDGSTFVIKEDNNLVTYRIDGWMYPRRNNDSITLEEARIQFPIWDKTWKNNDNKEKYTYLYMGFGNGLCVDNSIYSEYEPYLNELVDKYLENKEYSEDLKYSAIFNVWNQALTKMNKENNLIKKPIK